MNENLLDRVAGIYQQLLRRWNARDAQGFVALFAADGRQVAFDGSAMDGRVEIASTLAAVFQNEQTESYVATIREVREIAPGVVLLRSVVGMVPPDSADRTLGVHAVQSVVFVQRHDQVQVVLMQSTPAAYHGRPEVAELLAMELDAVRRSQRAKH
jgi:uncharacterized protein (TIGR02246 family)